MIVFFQIGKPINGISLCARSFIRKAIEVFLNKLWLTLPFENTRTHSTLATILGNEYAEDVLQGKISGTFTPVIGRKKATKAEDRRVAFIIDISQKYVLTLLAQGYKNAEIVEMTGLTLNTIWRTQKWCIRSWTSTRLLTR